MSRNVRIFNGLLSSPRGIEADREAVRTAVDEVNKSLRQDGLQVELLDWEKDARPSVGADGQDVINRQLCEAADFGFVLVHDRIGSPTPRYASGTVEEAEILLERIKNGNPVDLLVFFKKPVVNLTQEVIENLQKVLDFRIRLESEGVFWKEYADAEDLERLIRIHLPNSIRELARKSAETEPPKAREATRAPVVIAAEEDELGALDFEIMFQDALEVLTECTARLTLANETFTSASQDSIPKLEALALQQPRDPKGTRVAINETVSIISEYNDVICSITPPLRVGARGMTSALIGMVSMSGEEVKSTEGDLINLLQTAETLSQTVAGVVSIIEQQIGSVHRLPRMTKELNMVKREGIAYLEELLTVLNEFKGQIDEVADAVSARSNIINAKAIQLSLDSKV